MKKYTLALAFLFCTSLSCIAKNADQLAIKYCKQEFRYTGSLPIGYTGNVNKKMYLERMLQLKDGKLNAYFAKDIIKDDISMYEHFLETKKSWKGSDLTKERAKEFTAIVKRLKLDLAVIEKSYPTDLKVYDRMIKPVKQNLLERTIRAIQPPTKRSSLFALLNNITLNPSHSSPSLQEVYALWRSAKNMDFSETLNSWIISALAQHDLRAVRGFAFNLMEPSSGGFGIELIGADEFSLEDPDWACAEIFVANPRSISIPDDIHDGTWQSCLKAVKLTLAKLLQSECESSSLLQQADGIGVGFVDGDLLIIHPSQSNETQ